MATDRIIGGYRSQSQQEVKRENPRWLRSKDRLARELDSSRFPLGRVFLLVLFANRYHPRSERN